MADLKRLQVLKHDKMDDVRVFSISRELKRGVVQEVLVEVSPFGKIPLHTHTVDAEMIIVSGRGYVLSGDKSLDGVPVQVGEVVFFEKEIPHGFQASREGLTFISRNGGIVAESSQSWDIDFL